jgi:D-3-phosphoglycerate dehydrogenase
MTMAVSATDIAAEGTRPTVAFVLSRANPPQLGPTLERYFHVHGLPDTDAVARSVAGFADKVRALVTTTVAGADRRLIAALPNLELVVCLGGHVDRIDRQAAGARGIPVTNTPNVSSPDVADLAIALMLGIARRVCESDRFVRAGRWTTTSMPFGRRVNGKRLGIVGLGTIGSIVARRAEGFDMEIAYFGRAAKKGIPYRFYDDVVQMAADVDFLTLHCKSGPETRHLVDARVLKALGPEGFLINAARGEVVDERALIQALRDGTIAGAGLDVFENEPCVSPEFTGLDNVVVQAHHGAYTVETKQIMTDLALANLQAHFAGKPLVTPVSDAAH